MTKDGKLGIAVTAMLLLSTCHQAVMTAPPGSTLSIFANPKDIPASGGVSLITVYVLDGTGQPVADGTQVQFFTDLGRVDPIGRTDDGIAKVNLVSDGRSGVATVYAFSGGEGTPAPTETDPPAATLPPTSSAAVVRTLTASTASLTAQAFASTTSVNTKVTIGSKLPKELILSANPRNIAHDAPRFTTLTATVFDENGNGVANVPVVFRITVDADFTEFLDSGGRPIYTNNSGEATDRLWTSLPRLGRSSTVEVEAAVAGVGAVLSKPLEVGINF